VLLQQIDIKDSHPRKRCRIARAELMVTNAREEEHSYQIDVLQMLEDPIITFPGVKDETA
jgi:hypothetical protein